MKSTAAVDGKQEVIKSDHVTGDVEGKVRIYKRDIKLNVWRLLISVNSLSLLTVPLLIQ